VLSYGSTGETLALQSPQLRFDQRQASFQLGEHIEAQPFPPLGQVPMPGHGMPLAPRPPTATALGVTPVQVFLGCDLELAIRTLGLGWLPETLAYCRLPGFNLPHKLQGLGLGCEASALLPTIAIIPELEPPTRMRFAFFVFGLEYISHFGFLSFQ
jgi:hypothetical protein